MSKEPIVRLNLCPDCVHCPEVRVYPDRVEIGEEPHLATLTPGQWGVLVGAVRQGKLDAPRKQDCPCGCGYCPCGCGC
ncbi:MAG: hypothetical protein ACK4K2_02680 [Dehalococcoidia bacterium]